MGIWRESMFAKAATTKSVREHVARILELSRLRCGMCSSWFSCSDSVGPIDPHYACTITSTCACGHVLCTRKVVTGSY